MKNSLLLSGILLGSLFNSAAHSTHYSDVVLEFNEKISSARENKDVLKIEEIGLSIGNYFSRSEGVDCFIKANPAERREMSKVIFQRVMDTRQNHIPVELIDDADVLNSDKYISHMADFAIINMVALKLKKDGNSFLEEGTYEFMREFVENISKNPLELFKLLKMTIFSQIGLTSPNQEALNKIVNKIESKINTEYTESSILLLLDENYINNHLKNVCYDVQNRWLIKLQDIKQKSNKDDIKHFQDTTTYSYVNEERKQELVAIEFNSPNLMDIAKNSIRYRKGYYLPYDKYYRSSLTSLSKNLLLEIVRYLGVEDFDRLRRTSKSMFNIGYNNIHNIGLSISNQEKLLEQVIDQPYSEIMDQLRYGFLKKDHSLGSRNEAVACIDILFKDLLNNPDKISRLLEKRGLCNLVDHLYFYSSDFVSWPLQDLKTKDKHRRNFWGEEGGISNFYQARKNIVSYFELQPNSEIKNYYLGILNLAMLDYKRAEHYLFEMDSNHGYLRLAQGIYHILSVYPPGCGYEGQSTYLSRPLPPKKARAKVRLGEDMIENIIKDDNDYQVKKLAKDLLIVLKLVDLDNVIESVDKTGAPYLPLECFKNEASTRRELREYFVEKRNSFGFRGTNGLKYATLKFLFTLKWTVPGEAERFHNDKSTKSN